MNAASRSFLVSICAAGFAWSAGGQQLPVKGAPEDLRKDAGELIDGLPLLTEPAAGQASAERTLSIEQADAQLEEAKRKQQRWAKLAQQGILSKAEAEQSILEVAKAALHCAGARLARAMEEFDAAQQNPAAAAQAAAALESAKAADAKAAADLDQTRLQIAQASLQRFRLLYAERLVTKDQFQRMEAQVARLQAQVAAP